MRESPNLTPKVPQLSLAPLGAGDLIDRAIRLYRRHFMTLVRAAVPPVIVSATGGVLWTLVLRGISAAGYNGQLAAYFGLAAVALALIFVGGMMNLIVMGGASRNLVAHLMSNEPVSARAIYRSVRARFWSLLGAAVLFSVWCVVAGVMTVVLWYILLIVVFLVALVGGQILSSTIAGLLAIVLGAASVILALAIFFFLVGRVAYMPQVLMVEGGGVMEAMSRSLTLARGNVRRLLAMFLFTIFATYAALMLLLIPLGYVGWLQGVDVLSLTKADAPVWYSISYQVIAQCSSMLLTPVWMLGLSLLYVDERVRHEGYDIELMAARRLGEIPQLNDGRIAPLAPALAAESPASAQIPLNQIPREDARAARRPNNSTLGLS